MAEVVSHLVCPGCAARVSIDQHECEWCHSPLYVTSFRDLDKATGKSINKYVSSYNEALSSGLSNPAAEKSLGICYLKLGLYEKAKDCFNHVLDTELDDSELYFYLSVSVLGSKKPFLQQRSVINTAENYLNTAISLEPRGIYYYFLAYIKYDYYERKYLNTRPTYKEVLSKAISSGVSDYDMKLLEEMLGSAIIIKR